MAPVKFMMAAAVAVVLAGPALAQAINMAPQDKRMTSEEIEKQREIDRAYKDAISKLPDQQRSNDPWGNIRSVDPSAPKTAAKPAKPAAKPAAPKNANVGTQAVR
jgi:hypothetical protein